MSMPNAPILTIRCGANDTPDLEKSAIAFRLYGNSRLCGALR